MYIYMYSVFNFVFLKLNKNYLFNWWYDIRLRFWASIQSSVLVPSVSFIM